MYNEKSAPGAPAADVFLFLNLFYVFYEKRESAYPYII